MSEPQAVPSGEPLVILAAGGAVPYEVARAADAVGRRLLVIALEGESDDRLKAFPLVTAKWGQLGKVISLIEGHGGRDVVLIGSVTRRPDFSSLGIDLGTLRLMPRIIKSMVGGDDTVLGHLVRFLEERGNRVLGAHEVAPELVAVPGHLAGPRLSDSELADGRIALDAAKAIGALDIGQAAVAVGKRVVALEAAEGTDAMIERVATLRANGRVKWSGRAGVMAKRSKPQQDIRVDMPAIGPRTVEAIARAGLAGIAIEAGRVMIAERGETIALAQKTGTFIYAEATLP